MDKSKKLPKPTKSLPESFGIEEPDYRGSSPNGLRFPLPESKDSTARRAAYMHLARTIGLSFLQCRRAVKGDNLKK